VAATVVAGTAIKKELYSAPRAQVFLSIMVCWFNV